MLNTIRKPCFYVFFVGDETTYLGPFRGCLIWLRDRIVLLMSKFLFQHGGYPMISQFLRQSQNGKTCPTPWNYELRHRFQIHPKLGQDCSCHFSLSLCGMSQEQHQFIGMRNIPRIPWICGLSMIWPIFPDIQCSTGESNTGNRTMEHHHFDPPVFQRGQLENHRHLRENTHLQCGPPQV